MGGEGTLRFGEYKDKRNSQSSGRRQTSGIRDLIEVSVTLILPLFRASGPGNHCFSNPF